MNRFRRLLTGIFALILAGNLGVPLLLDPKPIQPTDISSTQTQSPDNLSADLGLEASSGRRLKKVRYFSHRRDD